MQIYFHIWTWNKFENDLHQWSTRSIAGVICVRIIIIFEFEIGWLKFLQFIFLFVNL